MHKTWQLEHRDPQSHARAGWLLARDGTRLPTPLFQPVATAGSLKTLDWTDLTDLGYGHVLMNTYHLVLRPGLEQLEAAGGLRRFTGWTGSILTDSGGYQAHSLSRRRKVLPEGIKFSDHIEGREWLFTPEFVLRAQQVFGVDFAMCLDICTSLPATREQTARDMALTHAWAAQQAELWPLLCEEYAAKQRAPGAKDKSKRDGKGAKSARSVTPGARPSLLGIVQGGLEEDLRRSSIDFIASQGFDGIAVGGLAVGEPREDYLRLAELCGPLLPDEPVHYLMGVGNPADLLHAIAHGFDLFDCVQPTRMARHGVAYSRDGNLNLHNARYKDDPRPLDSKCRCRTCRLHSRAYLRHLLKLEEHSFARLLTIHNLAFYHELLARARRRILKGRFGGWWQGAYGRLNRNLPDDL